MRKTLELTIESDPETGFGSVIIYEPESGYNRCFDFPVSPDEHPEFDRTIGEEIYSWIQMEDDY